MKRVLFSMVLLMAVSFSFAQMKNVKEAKSIANDVKPNFKQAEQLIEEAMKNPETKDLADTWDVAGFIQKRINEEQMKNAFLKKPYDTLKVYNSILKMYEYYNKCDDLAQVPNEKGKIKNKYLGEDNGSAKSEVMDQVKVTDDTSIRIVSILFTIASLLGVYYVPMLIGIAIVVIDVILLVYAFTRK